MLINESIKNGSIRIQIPAQFNLAGLTICHCHRAIVKRWREGKRADSIDSAFLWPDMRRMTLTPNKQQF